MPKAEVRRLVHEAAGRLGLDELLDRKPRQLSGGQRQRVALGRALVRHPQVFLMDEPLSNLDAKLRVDMRAEIKALQRETGVTTVFVTHDQVEAMTMGDRIAVMRGGRARAGGRPGHRLQPPRQRVRGRLHRQPGDDVRAVRGRAPATAACGCGRAASSSRSASPGDGVPAEVIVGVRPEHVRPWSADARAAGAVLGRRRVDRGARPRDVRGRARRRASWSSSSASTAPRHHQIGEPLEFGIERDRAMLFDPESEGAIGG